MSSAKFFPAAVPKRKGGPANFEDDCGFVFRRKVAKVEAPKIEAKPVVSKAVPTKAVKPAKKPAKPVVKEPSKTQKTKKAAAVEVEAAKVVEEVPSVNPTPSKRQVLERHRRRSSLSGLSMGRRRSSVGIGFTQDMPPPNVEPASYHKHILPDLPGPLKMKQMLIWAVQKASKELQTSRKSQADWDEIIAEPLTQGLHKNELNTSWYQRPSTNTGSTQYRPNPVNVDMRECHGLYQRYYRQLTTELAQWKSFESHSPSVPQLPEINDGTATPQAPPVTQVELASVCKWLHRLPFHVDRLGWLLHLFGNFEGRSKQYCEDVFHQIFERFFAGQKQPGTNPVAVLKALSAATE